MGRKDDRLHVRCESATKTRFQRFAAYYDDQEEALVALLDAVDDEPDRLSTVDF